MTPPPAVSVCIRAYRRPDDLRVAIASALDQTFRDVEVIVSDDGGRMAPVVAAFDDPRLRYEPNPGLAGPAANLRRAFQLSKGGFLAILNEDDRWRPGFLAAVVDAFGREPDAGVVFTSAAWQIGDRERALRLPHAPGRHDRFALNLFKGGIPASSAVIRREVWEQGEREIPLADGMVADSFIWLRAAGGGWPFVFVDEPLAVLRLHSDQISWSRQLPLRQVATLDAIELEDAGAEAARRTQLANIHLAAARVMLWEGRVRSALIELRRAIDTAPGRPGLQALIAVSGVREAAYRHGARHPERLLWLLERLGRLQPAPSHGPAPDERDQ